MVLDFTSGGTGPAAAACFALGEPKDRQCTTRLRSAPRGAAGPCWDKMLLLHKAARAAAASPSHPLGRAPKPAAAVVVVGHPALQIVFFLFFYSTINLYSEMSLHV